MKRVYFITCIVVLVFLLAISAAAATTESESNNTAAEANLINVNEVVTGAISTSADVDWYVFSTTQQGYFSVSFEHELFSSDYKYWEMRLYNSTAITFIDGCDYYYYWTGKTTGSTNVYGIPAGTYYIQIKKSSYASEKPYNINVVFTPTTKCETENNNTKESATPIALNEAYKGALSSSGDADWYKFSFTDAGFFYIDFKHDLIDSTTNFWRVWLYDETGVNPIDGCNSYFSYTGKTTGKTSFFGVNAGVYYVKVAANSYSGIPYSLTVTSAYSSTWEIENNNTKDNATPINTNREYSASISSSGDVDWYAFSALRDGYFSLNFNHTLIDSTSTYWKIWLYDDTGVNSLGGNAVYYAVDGKNNYVSPAFGVAKGAYYIKIEQGGSYSETVYNLKIDYTADDNWEKEDNGSSLKATPISINNVYHGSLTAGADEDWYTVTLSSSIPIFLTFNHRELESSSNYWKIYLYNTYSLNQVATLTSGGKNNSVSTNSISAKNDVYYVKIVKDSNYSDVEYSFSIHTSHTCEGELVNIENPTCTKAGVGERYCSICGKLLGIETVPPSGHTSKNWTIDKEATCTEKGLRHAICDVCKKSVSEEIEKLPHELSGWIIVKAPTCHASGRQMQECANCDYEISETLPALTHQFGDWIIVKETSCYNPGLKEKICSLCGDSEQVVIEQLTHNYTDWKVIRGSKLIPPIVKEKTCIYCGDSEITKDWSYVWISIVTGVALIGAAIGVINYIRAFKKK